jgi:hypothetical protein
MQFRINIEGFVRSLQHQQYRLTTEYTPMDFLVVQLKFNNGRFQGIVAIDQQHDKLVFIPVSDMEIKTSTVVPIIPIYIEKNSIVWHDSYDRILHTLNNYHCTCSKVSICIHCQFVRNNLLSIDTTRLITVHDLIRYLYTHVTTCYEDLISENIISV